MRNFFEIFKSSESAVLNDSEMQSISMRADIRRREQSLRRDVLNIESPGSTDEQKDYYKAEIDAVFHNSAGTFDNEIHSQEDTLKSNAVLLAKAVLMEDIAPNFAAFAYATAAKRAALAHLPCEEYMSRAKTALEKSADLPRLVPQTLLPDAILLGIQKRLSGKTELPAMKQVVASIGSNPDLLADYALVLPETERDEFLQLLPEKSRRIASALLDKNISTVLHQSLIEKGGDEEGQRGRVRSRLFKELGTTVEGGVKSDRQIAKLLSESLSSMGQDTKQLLLEIIRSQIERAQENDGVEVDYVPRALKVFLDQFDDWRGNDIALHIAGDATAPRHIALYILKRLVKNGYLPKDVEDWWKKTRAESKLETKKISSEKEREDATLSNEKYRLEVIALVISDLGVIPTGDILAFIADNKTWIQNGHVLSLDERIEKIKASQSEFAGIDTVQALVRTLKENSQKSMIFYLLHGGEDRFNLINNYDIKKFQEMLGLINGLKIHQEPLDEFESALQVGGLSTKDRKSITANLMHGHHALSPAMDTYVEVSFDVSENAAIKNANAEISQILGRKQLGTLFLFPMYREFLEKDSSDAAHDLLQKLQKSTTLLDRHTILAEIEAAFPQYQEEAINQLTPAWEQFAGKMELEHEEGERVQIPLSQVCTEDQTPVRGEKLIPLLDKKRIDLHRIKKELLVYLKGENLETKRLRGEISKKRKNRESLLKGIEKQQSDSEVRAQLEEKISAIEGDIARLQDQLEAIGSMKVADRFADMSAADREEKMNEVSNEIIALTEKSESAIFTYIAMQVIGEERLTEQDVVLIREVESHLQSPFQTIKDSVNYQELSRRGQEKKSVRVGLRYLDKVEHLMTMVRFADSKICCFSSNNYIQVIQHETPNKHWVASIAADPLSFVISMESPSTAREETQRAVRENNGFIFGNFGVDENGGLAVLLNGIYYAPGIEDERQVEAIVDGVKKHFAGLPVKTLAMATQHGGAVKMPQSFSNEPFELTRLRALDDEYGSPETKIYDDLGTGSDLNKPHEYGGHVWHTKLQPKK